MRQDEATAVIVDGLECVETEDGLYGLGLELPEVKTEEFPTLATGTPLLSPSDIKRIVQSAEWGFGRHWFDKTWLTNQNGHGSCASYAGASSASKRRVLDGQGREDLSGDYLYSLVNGGRDRGSALVKNMRKIMTNGVATKETVPLGDIYPNRYDKRKADAEARRFRGHELFSIPDEQSMATALVLRMPVVHAIHVGRNWRKLDGDVLRGDSGHGNHSEHCDDIRYNSREGRFEFRNGSSHNRDYFWVYWDKHFKQTSRNHQFYAVPSMLKDPEGDNPTPGGDGPRPAPPATVTLRCEFLRGCGPCERWKRRDEPMARAAGIELVEGGVPGSGFPRFTLRVGDREETHVGYWRFEDIELAAARLGR